MTPRPRALLAALVAVAAAAAPCATRATSRAACRIEGWSIDPDPSGLRVRAGPARTAREIGRLPGFVRDRDGDYGPAFTIVAARDGWLKISGANDRWRPSDLPPRAVFAGSGWIHGSRVRLAVQSGIGRAAPRFDAATIVDSGDQWLTDAGVVDAVTDCAGDFARLRYHLPAGAKVQGARNGEAWFDRTCGDQRTTCDLPPSPRH